MCYTTLGDNGFASHPKDETMLCVTAGDSNSLLTLKFEIGALNRSATILSGKNFMKYALWLYCHDSFLYGLTSYMYSSPVFSFFRGPFCHSWLPGLDVSSGVIHSIAFDIHLKHFGKGVFRVRS